jgi:hypothetical protein
MQQRRAAYYVAFGPHGPRTPVNPPGTTSKIIFGVLASIAAAGAIFFAVRSQGVFYSSTCLFEYELTLPAIITCVCYALCIFSSAATPYHYEGVGGSSKRARKRDEDQPHSRYIVFACFLYHQVPDPSPKVFRPRVTRARASLRSRDNNFDICSCPPSPTVYSRNGILVQTSAFFDVSELCSMLRLLNSLFGCRRVPAHNDVTKRPAGVHLQRGLT